MKIAVVLPAYNEDSNIVTLCQQLHAALTHAQIAYELIVIVQGRDGTFEALQQLQRSGLPALRLWHFPEPLGVAVAFQEGFRRVANDATHVLTMDADLNHHPEELPKFLAALDADVDIVIGSRYVPGGRIEGMPPWKQRLSRLMNRFFSLVTPLHVADKTSGYRLQRRAVVDHVRPHLRARNFDFYIEYLLLAQAAGYRMREVPITYRARVAGKSKMPIGDTCLRYLRLIAWTLSRGGRPQIPRRADAGGAVAGRTGA